MYTSWVGITIVEIRVPSLAFHTMISSAHVANTWVLFELIRVA